MKLTKLTPKQEARYMDHVTTAARWYMNNQCTADNPWGGVHYLADEGRFVYEVYKATRWSRAMGVWGQALAVSYFLDLAERTKSKSYTRVAMDGARYLLSLQCLDFRYPECQGAFWEHMPSGPMCYIRDAATGCFGLNRLYRATGEKEYLDRAKLWCDWFLKYGCRKEHAWPYGTFDFKRRKAHSEKDVEVPGLEDAADPGEDIDGDWQAGAGLAFYYTGLHSGEKKYLEEGLKPMMEKVVAIYDRHGHDPAMAGWHGDSPITLGNDDFVLIALMAAFRHWKDERYLKHIKNRTRVHLDWMAADGTYPNFEATFVCSIEHLEYLRLAEEFGFKEHVDDVRAALEKTAEFGLTLQERDLNDPLFYGGVYGQSSFGVGRDRIHHRATGYSMNFYMKRAGGYWPPTLSSYGWGKM